MTPSTIHVETTKHMNNCRRPRHIAPTDLASLQREVLARGPEAALPQNLPDRWLRAIVRDMMQCMFDRTDAPSTAVGAVLLVLALALHREAGASTGVIDASSIPSDKLTDYFAKYRDALIEEIVARQTGVFQHSYSLSDIFD
ncbi:hypothetical protein EVC45_43460 [Paraburkholderia sp. UYCP14C]|uniref:hypothetical protein n=1 Tax=Paraburkholderia sp. UYCP14C TaxID=2511130 RepID=UPI0010229BDD|nr:hypothetical protein [Paraburkholderia sp. UYCP14C]RZF23611.1 hypothetical protein EVC45_43460 [Paraburkholderia sp. UYCP14C]